jgi:flagellar motor switch protein FliG
VADEPSALADLTSAQRAAAVIVAVGPDAAGSVLSYLDVTDVETLTREIMHLGRLPSARLDAIVKEILDQLADQIVDTQGGFEYAKTLLQSWEGSKAQDILERLVAAANNRPFNFMSKMDPTQVCQFLSDEHPQTMALVLNHLSPTLGAQVLTTLPEAAQGEVSLRLATMGPVDPMIIRNVEQSLEARLGAVTSADIEPGQDGTEALAVLLNAVDRSSEKRIFEHLARRDPELADDVRARMFLFEDLVQLHDKDIQEILRTLDAKALSLAMKGAKPEVVDKIFRNLSERASTSLKEEVEFLGAVKVSEVEAAQSLIVAEVRRLDEEGVIALRADEGALIE